MIKKITALLLLVCSASTSYANLLESGFNADYDVNYNGMELGVSKRSLNVSSHKNAVFKSVTYPEGFAALLISETITETSKLKITRDHIQPIEYIENKDKKGKIETTQLSFNWKQEVLENSYLKTTDKLQTNTHDLLSFQLNIMQDLQKNKKEMRYRVATRKHTRDYILNIVAKETIETNIGDLEVVKISTKPIEGKSQFTFWCAPTLEYLPIKIQKTNDKGDKFSFTIRAFSIQK